MYYKWKKAYKEKGQQGLSPKHPKKDPEIERLKKENEKLKKLLAEKTLELELAKEFIKKPQRYTAKSGDDYVLQKEESLLEPGQGLQGISTAQSRILQMPQLLWTFPAKRKTQDHMVRDGTLEKESLTQKNL